MPADVAGGRTTAASRRYDHVILDRDGVVNREPDQGWIVRPDDFVWERGSLEALTALAEAGITISVVTNQSCVGRGVATMADVEAVNERMLDAIAASGVRLAGLYVCPHADEHACTCRKPKPGMVLAALAALGAPPARTLLVGDAPRDLLAGLAGGVDVALVRTGKGAATAELLQAGGLFHPDSGRALTHDDVPVFDRLLDATDYVLSR